MLSPSAFAKIEETFDALTAKYGNRNVTLFLRRQGREPGFSRPFSNAFRANPNLPTNLENEKREYEVVIHAGAKQRIVTHDRSEAFAALDFCRSGPMSVLVPYDDAIDERSSSPYIIRIPEEELILHFEELIETPQGIPASNDDASLPTKAEIVSSIEQIQDDMRSGECYLMNYTVRAKSPLNIGQFNLATLLQLWRAKPSRFALLFSDAAISILSLSPERFVRMDGSRIFCEPIKGTIEAADGEVPTLEDARRLWNNRKEIFEQTMVVDLVRNDLNRICRPGTVEVSAPFYTAIAGPLLQMQSIISGELRAADSDAKEPGLGTLLAHILPIASVTGTPKRRVTELTRKYEKTPRGYYTGMFGIRTDAGEFDTTVLIRSHFRDGNTSYVGVGAGITTLSDPEAEYREFMAKLLSFYRIFPFGDQVSPENGYCP